MTTVAGVLVGVAVALLGLWLALVVGLLAVRPKGSLLTEAVRILPDLLRLLRRLAADRTLPRGVRVRLGLRRAGVEPVRRRWQGSPDGFATLCRLTGIPR